MVGLTSGSVITTGDDSMSIRCNYVIILPQNSRYNLPATNNFAANYSADFLLLAPSHAIICTNIMSDYTKNGKNA